MEPTAFNLEQKELSTPQQITQRMKISQDEQKSHFFQIYECKIKVCPLQPQGKWLGFNMLRND